MKPEVLYFENMSNRCNVVFFILVLQVTVQENAIYNLSIYILHTNTTSFQVCMYNVHKYL